MKAIEATRTRFTSKTTDVLPLLRWGKRATRVFFGGGGVKGERGEGNWTYRKAVRRREEEEEETAKWTPDALPVYLRTPSVLHDTQPDKACVFQWL